MTTFKEDVDLNNVFLETIVKTLKVIFLCAVVGIAAPVFAEGGSDRLIERIDSRRAAASH
ncbi:hypothetical protein HP532_15910 [Pseudomonas sp. CrR25]|nr:hypothetical protein [Pseudomonas sp. CrR25]